MAAVDRTLLAEHASFVRDGVRERALHLGSGDERLFAILTEPQTAPASDLGFVVAHSFGLEVLTLRRAERAIARALAAGGVPSLFVHRRGFGDSTGDPLAVTVDGQLDDLRVAIDRLDRKSTRLNSSH